MSKKFVRILCLVMSIIMVVGLLAGLLATVAAAATTTYQLVELLDSGKIKPLGRTQTTLAGDAITADWSGSGFDINVSGNGGTLTVGYKSNYTAYWAILVDGEQIWRGQTATSSGGSTFGATIPSGKHTVRVVKETQMSNSETGYSNLTTLAFEGTIEKAPANKGLYIEFVGDSITCGDGALGEYEPGVKWLGAHDSATHSYAYYAAEKLGADYSLVARGGIGLFVGISEAEGTAQKKGMQDIYNYVSAYNPTSNGEYSFSRQPDVVFIELGANDSISSSDQYKTIAYWKSLMEDFIDQVRSKNPNAQIVLHSTNATKYKALMEIKEARKESDPKIHTFYYAYLGNGSAALETQYAGHPDANDLERFGDALAKFLKAQDIVPTYKSTPSYTDVTYYISENGNDSNDGKTIDTAKKTLNAAYTQARTDNTFAPGSRVVIYVQGTVKGSSNNNQGLLTGGVLTATDGSRVPVLVTTYNYNGTKAVLNTGHAAVNDGNGAIVFYNDVTLKDITFQSTTNESTGYRDRSLYAGYGNTVTFDNVTFDMNGSTPTNNSGWRISCGTGFGSEALPTSTSVSTLIFKNGDYTNLSFVTASMSSGLWKSSTETIYDVPNADFRLIIEDGAKMSTVYSRYGTLNVGAASVTINGGSVQQYVGTADGKSSERRIYKGDINLTVNGGEIYGTHFSTAGRYVTVEGDINTTINGGIFEITPKDTGSQYDAYFFGGRQNCVVENINTTINGGQLYLICDVASVDTAYYFGVSGGGTVKNVTNKISGGLFMPYARKATGAECNLYLGNHTGHITGTLRNEITGGNFQFGLAGLSNRSVVAGSRGVNLAIGKIENVFGKSGSTHGPNMSSAVVRLAGGWAQVGVSSKLSAQPTECSDTVVVSNTIYGGNYNNIYLGSTGNPNATNGHYSFIKGSIENKIYGGFFQGTVFGAGNGPVYGHVKTNVYGGFFKSIYGGTEDKATVYDGVELNIYGLDEYYPVAPTDSWVFCAGNKSGKVPVPMTAGRDAIKYTIAPTKANELTLNTKLSVGSTDGTTSVAVSGGTFPRGFAVSGKTVGGALASGSVVFDASTGKKATYASGDASVSGSVVVDKNAESFSNELVYYVSENGLDAYSGTSMATPKKTFQSVFSKIISDNGGKSTFPAGTTVTIYVEGTVNNATGTGSQVLGGSQVLTMATIFDHVPITVTTYNYNGANKAMIVDNHMASNSGNASAYVVNDLYFKNIDIQSLTNPANGYADTSLYAAGCSLTFDNCSITTDGKVTAGDKAWKISADHFATGGFNPLNDKYYPHVGTVTFKNGDYTNLNRVAAVGASSIWRSAENGGSVYSIPEMSCKVIIEDGAHMGTVYTAYGTLGVGSATVEVRGGTVDSLVGTRSSASANYTYNTDIYNLISGGTVNSFMGTGFGGKTDGTSYYVTVNGNITNTFSGGTVGGKQLSGLNDYVKLNGDLTNTFSGATVEMVPEDTEQNGVEGIFLSGRSTVTITGDVTNNISAGKVGVRFTKSGIQSGIWLGLRSGTVNGNVTNNITGGEIYTVAANGVTAEYADFHTGCFSGGSITGTLTNNITGGTFEIFRGGYYLGQQGVSGFTGKIVTILGDKTTGEGPTFKGSARTIHAAGNFGRVGVSANTGTYPATSVCTDNVTVSTTVYGGTYEGNLIATVASGSETNVGYIVGSTQVDVYGGSFSNFYATGNAPIYGKATTNIHGGSFKSISAARNGTVYDGVELNIYGMEEAADPTGIFVNGTGKIYAQTAGRDAVKLTIDPKAALTLSAPISANSGTITGDVSVLVTGGTYTKGFAVSGVTVKEALAPGLVPLKDGDKTVVTVTDAMTTTGTDSVTLVSTKWTEETATLTLSDTSVSYDGSANAKVPTTTVKFHNSTLVKDVDYTVSYSRNGEATNDLNSLGTITVTVTAKAPWSGSLTATYTIVRDDAIGAAIAEVAAAVNAYDEATVTADDKSDLAALKTRIEELLRAHETVLTVQDKERLAELEDTRKELENVIASVEAALETLVEDANAYRADIVTADDTTALEELEKAIAALPDGNLTDAQKAEKKAAAEKVDAMQIRIQDIAAKLAELKAEAVQLDTATVTADDTEALADLAADLAALSDGNLTSAQRAEKQAAAEKVEALNQKIADTAAELAAVKEAAAAVDAATVTADDSDELDRLASDITAIPDGNLTEAQKAEKKAAAEKVAAAQKVISDTAADVKALQEKEAAIDAAGLTSADKAKLQALAKEISEYPQTNLTAGQKELLEQLTAAIANKIAIIEKAEEIAGDLGAIEAALAGKTTENVTSADSASLAAAKKAIDELQKDESLSAADKAKLTALETKVEELTAQLEKAEEAAEVPEAVEDLEPETVEKEDKAALEEAIANLEKAEAEYGDNYTAAEKQAIAEAKAELEETLAVIEAVEAVEEQAAALPKTAEPDDEKTIADLQAARAAYAALNDRQKAMVDEAVLKQMDELDAALRNYKITKGDKAEWTQQSGKDMSFTINGLLGKFEGILVDDKAVDSKNYTAKSGSTVITFSDEYLNTLAKGEHKLTVVFNDGSVEGTFTVKAKTASPDTGDSTDVMLLSLLVIFSMATAAAVTIHMKKRTR